MEITGRLVADATVRAVNTDKKFKSIMDGTAKQRAQVAFDLCGNVARQGCGRFKSY